MFTHNLTPECQSLFFCLSRGQKSELAITVLLPAGLGRHAAQGTQRKKAAPATGTLKSSREYIPAQWHGPPAQVLQATETAGVPPFGNAFGIFDPQQQHAVGPPHPLQCLTV